MPECTGTTECERHPHIRQDHPASPVVIEFSDEVYVRPYSDAWEEAEAEWERLKNSPEGRFMLDNLIVEGP